MLFLLVQMMSQTLSLFLFVLNQGTGKWYEMQDLQVTDILPQMITLSEAYIQASPPTHSVDVLNVAEPWLHTLQMTLKKNHHSSDSTVD